MSRAPSRARFAGEGKNRRPFTWAEKLVGLGAILNSGN